MSFTQGTYIVEERYCKLYGSIISINRKELGKDKTIGGVLTEIVNNSFGKVLTFGQTHDGPYIVLTWTICIE
jgi:hypothetical protein